MRTGTRYSFWRVVWVVTGVNLLLLLLAVIATSITPNADKGYDWNHFISLPSLVRQVLSLAFASVFYYFTLNTYYRLISERKSTINYLRPTIIAALALTAYNAINFLVINQWKMSITVNKEKTETVTTALVVFASVMMIIMYICSSLLIAYFTNLRDEKKQRKVLEEQKMQLEVEKSQANLNFLKAQINPHFLHNTLNFLYAKSLPYSTELSEGILTLSDIMRYALSEGNSKDGKAPLKDEIEHVRNVIKINQLRFSNNLKVRFEVEGVVNGALIIPFVLITLVENAFKHGDLKSPENPIDIFLQVDERKLRFTCRNKKKSGPKEISTGVGLDNIKKRLALAYGTSYSLLIKDEADIYTTELTINQL
jgi:two-component system LytT family sensor kinase